MTASSNNPPDVEQTSLYLATYQKFLTTQPFSSHTRRAYLSRTTLFCNFLLTHPLSYGDPFHVELARDYAVRDFKSYLKTSHAARPASVNLTLAALDHFYAFLGLAKPKVSREELIQAAPQALNLDEQKHLLRILQTTASLRDRAVTTLLLYTGLRIGECLALNLEDVILSERKGRVIVRSGKGKSYREVPLNSQTRQVLADWKDYRTRKFNGNDNEVVAFFLSRQGKRLTPRATDLRIRQLAAKAGLHFSAHTLRHTCLTNLVRGGHDLVLVAEIAGHKRLETTRRLHFTHAGRPGKCHAKSGGRLLMPVRLLNELERQKLNQFPQEISDQNVNSHYTLSLADLFLSREQRGDHQQLGFALQLTTLRYLGFCPQDLTLAPKNVVAYLADQLKLDPATLPLYGNRSHTRRDHLLKIQHHLGYRDMSEADQTNLANWLMERSLEHDAPLVLFILALERLKKDKLVRPGLTIVERLVASAREKAQQHTFAQLESLLTEQTRAFLDSLLLKDPVLKLTRLEWLRQSSVSNTPAAIMSSIEKLTFLREKGVARWDLTVLNPNRRKFLAGLGKRTSPQALSTSLIERRYPLLVAFVSQSIYELTDETIEMFDLYLAGVNSRSRRELDELRLRVAQAMNQTAHYFRTVGRVVLDPAIVDEQVRQTIYQALPPDQLKAAVEECDKLVRPLNDEGIDLLAERYTLIRHFAPKFLETFVFRAGSASTTILAAVEVLREVNQEHRRRVPGSAPLDFVSKKWEEYVHEPNARINRKYYELAVLWELRQELRAGNIWVEGSRRYARLESYLIPQEKWPHLKGEVYAMLNAPVDGAVRLKERGEELAKLMTSLNGYLAPASVEGESTKGPGQLRLEGGELIIPPLEAAANKPSVVKLKELIRQRLPKVELVDVLIEVDSWTHYSRCFKHAGGVEQNMADLLIHLYAAIMGQACNLTLASISRMTDLATRKIGWCANWYVRDETIKEAITTIVNYQYHQPLSRHWGDGTLSSSDGQRFEVKVKTRNATALPRYFAFGKGLTMYNWSSDLLVQYDSRVVPTTMRDATVILDAILDNESELLIATHTSDTAGFTHLVFGLFDLLGIQFSPRIRDLGDQQLFYLEKPNASTSEYANLITLFKGTIRQDLIIQHWDELMRLAGSLKLGWVPASLMISKLQSFPRQNALAQALAEYGKLCKTIFILRSIQNEQERHRDENQLNKGENLNGLREYLFFGQQGQLRKRQLEEQNTQTSCLTLAVNCVVVWNTVYMNAVIEQLRAEGNEVKDEDLAHIWPTRTEHLNVYGKYHFNLEEARKRQGLRPLRQSNAEAEVELE